MMEMLRTLVRDKAQAVGQQSNVIHPDQRKKDPAYQQRFTPPYAPNVHMAQAPPVQQVGGFPCGYANTVDLITIPDLNDPKEQGKIRNESSKQSEKNETQ